MPLLHRGGGGSRQGGIEFENRGQLGKLQQLADEIAGGCQLDRALGLRRQGNRYERSESSGVDHFHAAEVDHDSTSLGHKLGNFAGYRGSFNAISDSAFAEDHSNVFDDSGFESLRRIGLNSPPPKTAQSQRIDWGCVREWPDRASDRGNMNCYRWDLAVKLAIQAAFFPAFTFSQ